MKFPAITLAACLAACTIGDEVLTYDEFSAQAKVDPDTGVRFIDGDTPVATEEEMQELYAEYLAEFEAAEAGHRLIVDTLKHKRNVWSRQRARNLTYCIDRASFGAYYPQIVQAMNVAAGDWESAANVNFIHEAAHDDNCTKRNDAVVFHVRMVSAPRDFFAYAFWPSQDRPQRRVVFHVDAFNYQLTQPETIFGITRHELGHTLGFRHEHIHPKAKPKGYCRRGRQVRVGHELRPEVGHALPGVQRGSDPAIN